MTNPHLLVIPYPAQGHVNPMMLLCKELAKHGFKITFVNTEFNHKRVMDAVTGKDSLMGSEIRLVSISDGLGSEDEREDLAKLCMTMVNTMPANLEKLIEDVNAFGWERITCVVVDVCMGWAIEVVHKMGIRGAVFNPVSAGMFALSENIPKLIRDGIIDSQGFQIKREKFQLFDGMPMMDRACMPWTSLGDSTSQNMIFEYLLRSFQHAKSAEWFLCNTFYEIESGALSLCPRLLPIGPLMESDQNRSSLGQFWKEDLSCLNWLDQQEPCSVIYVAFGSFAVFDPTQFQEIALGLELTNKPFLWVVRPSTADSNTTCNVNAYLKYFNGSKGKIVSWAPQKQVLSHPAIACFISHCGWNSAMEGVINGVPFLCWPYFADQFFDKAYICAVWKVGLGLEVDEKGIVSREEIRKKVEQLLGDENIRVRSLKMKEIAMKNIVDGGLSWQNLNSFIKWLKKE